MFEKLVVSTAQRRKARTAKFFVFTSMFYLSAVAAAFVVSILISDPKLADSTALTRIADPPPGQKPPTHISTRHADEGTLRQDPTHVVRYEDLGSHSAERGQRSLLPAGEKVGEGDGVTEGDPRGIPEGIGSIVATTKSESAPRPPDPPKPTPPPKPDNRPVRLASSVLQGKVVDRRVPVYPELARRIRLQGDVAVEVIISPEGRVESARAVSGHPMLTASALDAARGWRFEATLLNGVPVRVTGVITFVFKLSD